MSEMTPNEFWSILHDIPVGKAIFYRLYYNDLGDPICYSMEDLPGNYIDIDAELFATRPSGVRVVNGKLSIKKPTATVQKLKPNGKNSVACDPRDITVIVDQTVPHVMWGLTSNEIE